MVVVDVFADFSRERCRLRCCVLMGEAFKLMKLLTIRCYISQMPIDLSVFNWI